MSFYSYKNSGSTALSVQPERQRSAQRPERKNRIQVQRVYDSCLMQEQLKEQKVTLLSYGLDAHRKRVELRPAGERQHPAEHADHL